jgi:hypothetical protein
MSTAQRFVPLCASFVPWNFCRRFVTVFVQLIGNKCLLVVRLGNGMEEMKKAAKAAHPSDFIVENWLRGEDLNL